MNKRDIERLETKRHHSLYASHQQVIHKCLLTYQDMSSNMPFGWYVQNVYDSANRKGFTITQEEVETWIYHFLQRDELKNICTHCMGTGINKKEKEK